MNKLSFQQKLWVPLLCSLLCIAAIFIYDLSQIRSIRIDERSNDIVNIDDVALSVVKHFGELAQAGTLTKEQAQQQAMAAVRSMRYGKDGYLSISSFDGVLLMHPFKPENEGKNMSDFKDAN
ncbi:MAG TPA: cache domain-containing protein, partial [Burkholderiaceae bacterium]|nr:cache domain-containing protein [Burkholderiaceae bacterium]